MSQKWHRWKVLGGLVFLSGCAPASLEDLRCQTEAEMRGLTEELRKVESKEDLYQASKKLKKYFYRIANLLVEARQFNSSEPEYSSAGEALFIEFARIYEMPGGKDAMESIQVESLRFLQKRSDPVH